MEIYYDADAKDQVSAQELEARTRACIEAGEFTHTFFINGGLNERCLNTKHWEKAMLRAKRNTED